MLRKLHREDGLTLVDLLIGLVLSAAVLGLTTSALHVATKTDMAVSQSSEALAQLRTTVQRLTKEVRQARRIYSDSDERTLHFWLDRNQNSVVDTGERIIWHLEAAGVKTTLLRSVDDAQSGVPEAVDFLASESSFAYARESGGTMQAVGPQNATVVTLAFAADVDPDRHSGPRWTRTEVRLRNVLA